MGTRGPVPLPTNIKKMRNTDRKDRAVQNEPEPDVAAPPCPGWLGELARKEWSRLVPELLAVGVLSKLDMTVLASYCHAVQEIQELEEDIRAKGRYQASQSGYEQKRPALSDRDAAIERANKFGRELGLTPSARTRISVTPKETKKANPFANLAG